MLNIIQIIWRSSHNLDVKYRVVLDRKYLTTYIHSEMSAWDEEHFDHLHFSGCLNEQLNVCSPQTPLWSHSIHSASGCWVTFARPCSTRRHVLSMWNETGLKMCVAWPQLGRAVNAGNHRINPDLVCLRIQISLSPSPVFMFCKAGIPELITYSIYPFDFFLTVSEIPNHPRLNLNGSLWGRARLDHPCFANCLDNQNTRVLTT